MSRARVAKLGKGIHENVVISKIDMEDRKKNGLITSKNLFITFATVDPATRKKKAELEMSWWRLNQTSEYFFDNLREMVIQINGILTTVMDEDEVYKAMEDLFADWDFKSVDDMKDHKWKKPDVEKFMTNLKGKFLELIKSHVGLDSKTLLRVKVTTDKKGEYPEMPKYGTFTESMEQEESNLRFSDAELRMHSNGGTVQNANAGSATSEISGL